MVPASAPALGDIEVIIPAYNAAPFIAETLESVLAQTLLPRCITVVDDRSRDGTADVVRAFGPEPKPGVQLRLLANAGPQGPAAARNTALRAAGPAWVAFQDADDLMLPHQLQALADCAHDVPEAVITFADTEVFNSQGVLKASTLQDSGALVVPYTEQGDSRRMGPEAFAALCQTGFFGTSACLVARHSATQAGLFDEAMLYGEDTDLFARIAVSGTLAYRPTLVSRKRTHSHNLTHPANQIRFDRGMVRMLAKLNHCLPDAPMQPASPALNPAQQQAVQARLSGAVQGYLWRASRTSWAAYRDAVALAWRVGYPQHALNPWHAARWLRYSAART
jgi:glycosyltransferase involved in cell wall biosynthesis